MKLLYLLLLHLRSRLWLTVALLAAALVGSQAYGYALERLGEAVALLSLVEVSRTLVAIDTGTVSGGPILLEPAPLPEPLERLARGLAGLEGVTAVYPVYELRVDGYRVLCGPLEAFQSLTLPYLLASGRWPESPGEAVSTSGTAPAPLRVVGTVVPALPAAGEPTVLAYCWSKGSPRFLLVRVSEPELAERVEKEATQLMRELGLAAAITLLTPPPEELERLAATRRLLGLGYLAASATLLGVAPAALAYAERRLYHGLAPLYAQAGVGRARLALLEAARYALILAPAAATPNPLIPVAVAAAGAAAAAAIASAIAVQER